jgi:hypothetical protein
MMYYSISELHKFSAMNLVREQQFIKMHISYVRLS